MRVTSTSSMPTSVSSSASTAVASSSQTMQPGSPPASVAAVVSSPNLRRKPEAETDPAVRLQCSGKPAPRAGCMASQ